MKFTLRDLFWLTLVVALSLGWWLDRAGLRKKASAASLQAIVMESKLEGVRNQLKQELSLRELEQSQKAKP